MASEASIRDAKRRFSGQLLRRPGVSGLGVERDSQGDYFLAVHLDSSDPHLEQEVAAQLAGLPVKFVCSGPFQKQ